MLRTAAPALILAAMVLAQGAALGATFRLTRAGEAAATIVVAREPGRAADLGALELRDHVAKITGVVLPIVSDEAPVDGPRVLVGESAATEALGLRRSRLGSQEYVIRFLPDTLILMGRDERPGRSAGGRGAPSWAEGRFGGALQFDGVDDVLVLPGCGFSDEAGSLEAWVWMPAEAAAAAGTILRLDGSDPWTYHILERAPGSTAIEYVTYDGATGHAVRSGPLAEGWHHLLATHSLADQRIELFVDGRSVGTDAFTPTTCKNAPLHIGALNGPPIGNAFRGLIDEVRVSTVVRRPDTDAAGGPYATDEHTGLLLHCDEGAGSPHDSSGRGTLTAALPDPFEEQGTLYAVYDFLERCCDVRWYLPGEIGTVYPQRAELVVKGEDVQRAPAMIHRWITPTTLYVPTGNDPVSGSDTALWKLRMRIGGQSFWVSHSFYGYYDRFLKDHPDWFAQGYEGQPPQMCYTNSEFIAQVVQDARDYFDGKGAQPGAAAAGDVFGLVPMDNMSWCKCPRCQAELNQAEMSNPQFTNGKASNYIWGFVNKVAREIAKSHPDKWIGALAYSDYGYYPTTVKVEPNVVVQMCLHTRNWFAPSMERNDRRVLNEWVTESQGRRPLYLWLYYCFPALQAKYEGYNAFPSFFAHTAVRQMAMYHQDGIRGIFMEHSSEFGQSHLMDVPDMYVCLKLADDPTLDGNALIDEFFERFYGAAAEPMRRLYERIEETYCSPTSYPDAIRLSPAHQHQNQALAWGSLGTDERMAEFGALMEQARQAARTDLERRRVDLFDRGIWQYMQEGQRQYRERQP